MNIKNKKTTGNICFFSFMKRLFICFLCIILCFNVVCKPKKTYAGTVGVAVAWGLSDYLAALLASAGIALTVDTFCRGLGIYGGEEEVTEEEALQWCKNNITVDGDNNVVFTDDAKSFINDYLLGTYKDSVTMTYRYPILRNHILGDGFSTNQVFQNFLDLLEGLPSCYFYFDSTTISSYDQNSLLLPTGEKYSCNNRICALDMRVLTDCSSGVCSSLDLASTSTTFYNDNWTVCKSYYVYLITPFEGTVDTSKYKYFYYSNAGKYVLCESFEDIDFSNCRSSSSLSRATMISQNYNGSLSSSFLYSAGTQALNCYKSVDDMKKDIGSQVIGNYIPDYYTGTPNYNIATSEVNNIVNNYYPSDDSGGGSGSGSGSGSDDNGGGSGGGIFDDIISGIASGVGSIIKGIFSIIKDLVEAVADAIVSITKSITDLSSLLKTDFTDFLSAVFPFLPQEFITIMIAGLTLCLLGIIIKIFRG